MGGVTVAIVLSVVLAIGFMNDRTIMLRSNAKTVNFITEGDTVTFVSVGTIEAAFSLAFGNSINVYIEVSDDIMHTYVFRFADKDITIMDGKIV